MPNRASRPRHRCGTLTRDPFTSTVAARDDRSNRAKVQGPPLSTVNRPSVGSVTDPARAGRASPKLYTGPDSSHRGDRAEVREVDPERWQLRVVAVVMATTGQPTEAPPRPGADLGAGQEIGNDPGRAPLHRNERLITLLNPRELARFTSSALTGVDDCP